MCSIAQYKRECITCEDYAHSCRVHNTGNEARISARLMSGLCGLFLTSKVSYENLLLPIFACGG